MDVTTRSELISVAIIGGGMVGLLLAALLANAEIKVTLIEAKKPLLRCSKDSLDSRVSAINAVSRRLLKKLIVGRIFASQLILL
ncbi:FAD-dependent oxidoreductase [Coxiella-like endosymbiont]|uniref:FAD-dependent oxidoreductase n=1 Tax=Coxiella-like endosymbiont TaxID=1592897 RepID=UPI00272CB55B|nr:FAD-dependent oxidoreductase [Coxiella-like endosymbiont]